jgi:hypothetical protein
MDRDCASTRLYSAVPPHNQHRSLTHVRPAQQALRGPASSTSAAGLLLLFLGMWAAVWATFASLSSWLR